MPQTALSIAEGFGFYRKNKKKSWRKSLNSYSFLSQMLFASNRHAVYHIWVT